MISVTIPIRLVSEMNAREHWAKKASRVRSQRAIVTMKLRTCALTPAWLLSNPAKMTASVLDSTMHEVTLTRIAPRPFDLHDNLRSSFKACVDSVASWLGLDDRDPRVRWSYAQEKGAPRYYAVRIEVRAVETGPVEWGLVMAIVESRRAAKEKRALAPKKARPRTVKKMAKRAGGRKR